MQSVDVDSSVSTAVDFITGQSVAVPKVITGDDVESAGYSIQTKDLCLFDIEFGNRAQNTAGKFVEEVDPVTGVYGNNRTSPLVVDAKVKDTQDGKYSYNLQVLDEGVFSLFLYYGDRSKTCSLDVTISGATYAVTTGPTADGCFYASALNAVRVLPATAAPTSRPTTDTLPPTSADDAAVIAGSIGGVLVVLGFIAAAFAVVYKRRWQKDKQYISTGAEYKNYAKTVFKNDDKHTEVGRNLLASRALINRQRARNASSAVASALAGLQTEQEELVEQIRMVKAQILREAKGKHPSETFLGVEDTL